jgi:hypothetical protein
MLGRHFSRGRQHHLHPNDTLQFSHPLDEPPAHLTDLQLPGCFPVHLQPPLGFAEPHVHLVRRSLELEDRRLAKLGEQGALGVEKTRDSDAEKEDGYREKEKQGESFLESPGLQHTYALV